MIDAVGAFVGHPERDPRAAGALALLAVDRHVGRGGAGEPDGRGGRHRGRENRHRAEPTADSTPMRQPHA